MCEWFWNYIYNILYYDLTKVLKSPGQAELKGSHIDTSDIFCGVVDICMAHV